MVRVQWQSKYTPTDHAPATLLLVTRSFMHGDVVVLASNPRGQSGTVIGLTLSADVRAGSDKRVERAVSSSRLGAWRA